jgi:site-specific recombinase XerD
MRSGGPSWKKLSTLRGRRSSIVRERRDGGRAIYKHKGSSYFHYDFVVQGRRFYGSTGQVIKRQAEVYERRVRAELAERGPDGVGKLGARDLTLDDAIGRWWHEKGQLLDSAADVERHLQSWIELFGKNKRLGSIRKADIQRAISDRRKIAYRGKLPSSATINRFVAAFRSVWRYVDDEDRSLPAIKWRDVISPEGEERVRELAPDETTALNKRLATEEPWLRFFVLLSRIYGLRYGEMFFRPEAVDCIARTIVFQKKRRKKPVDHKVQLATAHASEVMSRASEALAAGLDHIWFTRDGDRIVPLDKAHIARRIRKVIRECKISDLKIHDLRHDAATKLLRETGNLKVVQKAMGHASIQSTLRYAHVSDGDLRSAFEAVSRNSPEHTAENDEKKKAE